MPPPLAAGLFVLIIAWMLRRDRTEYGPMAPGLWIPLIWVTINASRPVVYWLASGDTAAGSADLAEGNAIDRNIYIALLIAGIVVLIRRRPDWTSVASNCRILIILYCYYCLSATWSEYPFVAFKRWVRDASDIIMALVILTDRNPLAALRTVFIRSLYILIPISVLFIKWYPALGRYTHRWTYHTFYCGVTTNKNSLGVLAMLGILFFLWKLTEFRPNTYTSKSILKHLPEAIILGMSIWLLSIANSSTSLVCTLLGSAILLGSRYAWFKANLGRTWWCAALAAFILTAFTVSESFRGLIAEALGRNATLTERTDIWSHSLALGTNPIIGTGFFSTWISTRASAFVEEYNLAHAHNGYLETYLHNGWIGVFLLVAMLLTGGRKATQLYFLSRKYIILIAVFWAAITFNYTEVSFFRSNPIGLLIVLVASWGPHSLATLKGSLVPLPNTGT